MPNMLGECTKSEILNKVYLACPYSDPDPLVREARFKAVNQIAADLMSDGFIVYSPISQTHCISDQCGLPKSWEFWESFDTAFIEWADMLIVAAIDGFDKSVGVSNEIGIALELRKPIRYYCPKTKIITRHAFME